MSMLGLSSRLLLMLLPQLLLLLVIDRSDGVLVEGTTQFDVGVDGQLNVEEGGVISIPLYAPKGRTENTVQRQNADVDVDVDDDEPECRDQEIDCRQWASDGECEPIQGNPEFMFPACPRSCNLCGKGDIQDLLSHALAVKRREISGDLAILGWGVEQEIFEDYEEEISDLLEEEARYMLEVVNVDEMYDSYKLKCLNLNETCALWALQGECHENYEFMNTHCAPICKACHMIDWYARGCSMPENASELDAWKPGDLSKMFERIVADYLNVNIISQPSTIEAEDGPWVLTIDDFLSDEDCAHLIAWGHRLGYERSPNDDGTDVNSVNEGRTSSHTWCEMQCHDDPKTMAILQRIEALTGISDLYSEDLQLLRYEPGQHYEDHHDYIDYELHRPQGVRILTVFMYLNDVEAGGGTKFTRLGTDGITVMPKKGSVLIWPSVLNDDPHSWDARTHHEALTLGAGMKFGANAWFHMRDFKTPMHGDCHFFY